MGIYNAIKKFSSQFAYEPKIENESKWEKFHKFVVAGMGGSNLTAGLVKIWNPQIEIISHRDYGLPPFPEKWWRGALFVASSYSGNTEETIDAFQEAGKIGLTRAAISIGGKLLELAKKDRVPYVQMPDTGIQPRSAVGYSFRALLKLIGEEKALGEMGKLYGTFHPEDYEDQGRTLAERLKGRVPIIYSSSRNEAIAQNWRVRFHETGKVPAYYNIFSELNHNEMTGFDVADSTRSLSKNFYFIFLKNVEDHPRIQKRMGITEKLYKARGLPVEIIELRGANVFYKIFSSLVLADWASYYLGESYGVETEQVPMVEELKKLIA